MARYCGGTAGEKPLVARAAGATMRQPERIVPKMPFSHTVEDRLLHITWFGVITRDDLQRFGESMPRIVAELGYSPNLLHTFAAVEGYTFQPLMVYTFSLLRKRVAIPSPVLSAAVARANNPARNKEVLALARLFKAMNRSPNLTIEVFTDEAAARAWLAAETVESQA